MDPNPSFDQDRPPEHAFGKIHEITVPIEWALTPANPRRKAHGFTSATTQTWSVNGVGFVSKTDRQIIAGTNLTLRIGPVDGQAIIRTTERIGTSGNSYYGAEFIGSDLQDVARDLISIHLRHNPADRPHSSSPLDEIDATQANVRDWM